MYCTKCGAKMGDGDAFCGQCGARVAVPPAGSASGDTGKDAVLLAIENTLNAKPGLAITRSRKSDIEIASVLADTEWSLGKKKVEFLACLLAEDKNRTIIYWEMIKEVGSGLGALFSFKTESYRSDGKTISGKVKESGYGFGDKIIDYDWDYSLVRQTVKAVAEANGWQFKTVLLKGKAMY